MRIAVVGPQNVGKTTFIKDFIFAHPEYTTHAVSYREIIEREKLTINQETDESSQGVIMSFLAELINNNGEKDVIFDRAVIDNLAYSLSAFSRGKVSAEFIENTRKVMYGNFKHLDAIFFIPASLLVELKDDKFRDTDRKFIDQVNRIFIEILLEVATKNVIPIKVLSGTREERVEQIKKYI